MIAFVKFGKLLHLFCEFIHTDRKLSLLLEDELHCSIHFVGCHFSSEVRGEGQRHYNALASTERTTKGTEGSRKGTNFLCFLARFCAFCVRSRFVLARTVYSSNRGCNRKDS